jgi:hypothetical protein
MPLKGKKVTKKGTKKGGGHTNKPSSPAKNYLLNPIKMTAFKTPVSKKAPAAKKDVVMSSVGSRQSVRASNAPKKLEVSFKKVAPKSSYVPISDIPKRIEEYELLIESKKKEIEKYEAKIAELKNKQLDANIKASKIDDISNLMSRFRF